jgi:hypothetical protein
MDAPQTPREGHPIEFVALEADQLDTTAAQGSIEAIIAHRLSGVIVRGAFPADLREAAVARLSAPELAERWASPNKGMHGGEIRVIGDAATPTFTALRGPSPERYAANAQHHAENAASVFGTEQAARDAISGVLSALFGGRPAAPPALGAASTESQAEDQSKEKGEGLTWAPFNVRALDPGQQIYTHHDDHYGLAVYGDLDPELDREVLLSWFVTLEAPEGGGQLVIYGLWGSDPNPPVLPSRFLDTAAIEQRFNRHRCDLRSGDLIVFNAGKHVHRVTPVEGTRPRLTMGGFLTVDRARTRLAFWS